MAEKKTTLNILEHFLNPKMKVMKKEEVKNLLEEYNIKKEQLPKFLENDPVVRALGAKKGDVIMIEREDKTGKYFYYRVVV